MRLIACFTIGFTLAVLFVMAAEAAPGTYVKDGDTIVVRGETVRVKGIDTPEIQHEPCFVGVIFCGWYPEKCAYEARDFTLRLLAKGHPRLIRLGKDRYGRTLAYVEVAGRDLGLSLLRAGLAKVMDFRGERHPRRARYARAERRIAC